MHYGLTIFPTEYSIQPAELGREAEARGFESLWVAEHTHIPASRRTPWPGGSELPKMYYDTYDPFVALTAVAAATTKLKVATGICLAVQHDPITLAKQIASLDCLSGGRFLFGVGGGWNVEEIENHGTPFGKRWQVLRERIEAMKAIWREEQAEYHGQFVDFEPIFSQPKPVQKPHPPIHVGGTAPHALRRVVRYADGWIPILGRGGSDLAGDLETLRKLARDAGSIEVSIYAAPPDDGMLAQFRDVGVTRAVFFVPSSARDDVLPLLDRYAELAKAG